MQKIGKVLRTIAICIGCIFFLSALISKGVSFWTRIRDVVLGVLIITFATTATVRQLGISLLAFILGISSVMSMLNKGHAINIFDLLLSLAFFGTSIYFFRKAHKHIKEFFGHKVSGAFDSPDNIIINSQNELSNFMSSHTLLDEIYTKVVGVTFRNDNGTSRQDILSLCCSGDELALEFYQYNGSPAYAVHSKYGQIGNLSAQLAKTIDTQYDGCIVQATITSRTGGYGGLSYGCNILIKVFGEKTQAETPANVDQVEQILDQTIQFSEPRTQSWDPEICVIEQAKSWRPEISATEQVKSAKPKILPTKPVKQESSVDYSFIAESQWYASRHDGDEGGADAYL